MTSIEAIFDSATYVGIQYLYYTCTFGENSEITGLCIITHYLTLLIARCLPYRMPLLPAQLQLRFQRHELQSK